MMAPVIDPRYLDDPRDMEVTVRAAERLRAVAAAPSLASVTVKEILPGSEVRTPADWAKDISANAGNHYHVSGTCRMGRSIADSVTDPRLRVHGLRGLRVADAGVMPLLMNGNTNAAVMMIAERAAEAMTEEG
jgi:choline dehydrogenase-like flavoprotein